LSGRALRVQAHLALAVRSNALLGVGAIGFNGELGNLFSEHNAVAVRRHDCELTHPPRLVFQLMPYLYVLFQELPIQTRSVSDMKIREP
jgi:hypothetical protein